MLLIEGLRLNMNTGRISISRRRWRALNIVGIEEAAAAWGVGECGKRS